MMNSSEAEEECRDYADALLLLDRIGDPELVAVVVEVAEDVVPFTAVAFPVPPCRKTKFVPLRETSWSGVWFRLTEQSKSWTRRWLCLSMRRRCCTAKSWSHFGCK